MFPSRIWREMPQRYRLEASICKKCGKRFYPPRLICDQCGFRKFESYNLPEEGKLQTFTVIRIPASQFSDQSPYAIGIVKFDDSLQLMAQIVDCDVDKLKIGQKVRLEFRRIQTDKSHGVLSYAYKLVPKWY
ncbi:MAG: Zn-ribbon domain-containing OB-fold protein [candidate division Zixibacteria bacterium]